MLSPRRNLYTEANWQRFPALLANLKQNCEHNPTIMQPFLAPAHLVNADVLRPFIRDFFVLTAHMALTLDGWGRGNLYYPASSTQFLEEHLWVWWFEERVKGPQDLRNFLFDFAWQLL
ncbi:hypothetical protein B0H14DRAFT_3457195 [Mycena olivaceomarginata]|nr:hypothetical protein B0H14DRAFT_3457195 [Mycena olivaceomarginata]